MQIEQMSATFGRLNGSQLDLQPGLNVICAPNESGKSTWCRFLQNMLYGVPTKERGLLADKNRYAPWSGSPMQGRLLLRNGDARYTLLRETRRTSAPMGDAHLTYTGTADPVPGILAAEAGQYLLGIPREVFLRSAFIGQNALAVDQDAELERRIAALISTGEEDTSYSESYERLKKQLNARRANRSTGQIPALEQEIAQLEDALARQESLREQLDTAQLRLQDAQHQLEELQQQDAQWQQLERQAARHQYEEAQAALSTAQQQYRQLEQRCDVLPDEETLSQLEGQATALTQSIAARRQATEQAAQLRRQAAEAMARCTAHPLSPADGPQLQSRLSALTDPPAPSKLPLPVGLLLLVGAVACVLLHLPVYAPILCGAVGAAALLYDIVSRHRHAKAKQQADDQRSTLQRQIAEYLPLLTEAQEATRSADAAAAAAEAMAHNDQAQLLALLARVRAFHSTAVDLPAVQVALSAARRSRTALRSAQTAQEQAQMYCRLLEERLPQGELPDPAIPLPRPSRSVEAMRSAIPEAQAQLAAARTRLDTISGQLQATRDPSELTAQLAEKRRKLESLQSEYEAIQLAMDALSAARRSRTALRSAQTAQEQAQMYCRLLEERLPQGELPDPAIPLPRPSRSVEAMRSAIPEAQAQLAAARTRLDTISGQLQATRDPSELTAQLAEKRRKLESLQSEYEAIQLAMDALSAANQTLQNRFSPALGARTAEIFSALTGGRYDKVLLDRTLALSAEPSGDSTPRSIQVLSQGAADQLYLAVRLAICQLVLPPEKHVPLILDDVFASFDDQRLAAALEWLLQESQNRQILLFTCHDRERTYLAGRPGVHILTLNGGAVCSH